MSAPPFDRADALRRLADEHFDVLVVGGGITGAGVALDAAPRGLRTALVERDDFASGTSSKSSKLVHGGLRYLQQSEVRLVYEALAERQRPAQERAPPRARAAVPAPGVHARTACSPRSSPALLGARCGCTTSPAALRIGKLHKRISKDEALAHMPTLPADQLAAAYLYYDAQADDARLTLDARPHRGRRLRRRGRELRRASSGFDEGRRRPGRTARASRPTAHDDRRCAPRPS